MIDLDSPLDLKTALIEAEAIAESSPREGLPDSEFRRALSNWWLHRGNLRIHGKGRYPYGPNCSKCCRTSVRLVEAVER